MLGIDGGPGLHYRLALGNACKAVAHDRLGGELSRRNGACDLDGGEVVEARHHNESPATWPQTHRRRRRIARAAVSTSPQRGEVGARSAAGEGVRVSR